MDLSEDQIDLIRSSYLQVSHDLQRAGEIFYARLFEIAPSTQMMFIGDIEKQSGKLMSTLGLVVSQLQNWEELEPVVEDLALRHLAYGVKTEHYQAVGQALHAMFDEVLDHNYQADMRAAWDAAYRALSDIMIQTAYREREPAF